jgi:short chain dehydrogenase
VLLVTVNLLARCGVELNSSVAAVVTGGASGLGAATARLLASKGVKVALFDLDAKKGELVAREIHGLFCAVDVTADTSVDIGFAAARASHGQERVLVNCAGTGLAVRTVSRDKVTGAVASAPEQVKAALAASVPYPKRLGKPDEFAQLAVAILENGYFNGESVRLDGAIRIPPR